MIDHQNNSQGIMNQIFAMGIKFDNEIKGLLLIGVTIQARRRRDAIIRSPRNSNQTS